MAAVSCNRLLAFGAWPVEAQTLLRQAVPDPLIRKKKRGIAVKVARGLFVAHSQFAVVPKKLVPR